MGGHVNAYIRLRLWTRGRYGPKHSESNIKHVKSTEFDVEWPQNLGSIPKAYAPETQSPFSARALQNSR